jgi:hypothetical protein
MTCVISVQTFAPSTCAAWMTSRGISSNHERSIQTAIGRFIVVYMISSAATLSSSYRLFMMIQMGTMMPTGGRNLGHLASTGFSRRNRAHQGQAKC